MQTRTSRPILNGRVEAHLDRSRYLNSGEEADAFLRELRPPISKRVKPSYPLFETMVGVAVALTAFGTDAQSKGSFTVAAQAGAR